LGRETQAFIPREPPVKAESWEKGYGEIIDYENTSKFKR
jgi:hypothetical protein